MTEEQKTFADQKRKTVETAEFTEDGRYKRKVRSFVLRTGRLSDFQKNMMNDHWADLGLDYQNAHFDFATIYGNTNPVILEIGFGMGKSLVDMAEANPDKNYLGIEHDATEILRDCVKDGELGGLQLFFPDPWHKTKHHKRRIVQPHFVEQIVQKLQPNGFIHMATDWENYAEQMLEVLSANENLVNTAEQDYIPRPDFRPLTKFEARGHRLGHGVWDLYFKKK